MRYFIILLIVAFMGCRSGAGSHEGHDHTAEAHSHEGHDHAHDHEGHEGHDHAAEEAHDHDGHEGHDHEEPEEEAGHGDEIIFTRAQAEAAGLTIEPVEPGAFSRVIKTSGRIQSPQGGETVVAAASNGIVSFSGDLTEGRAVSKGGTLATISARASFGGLKSSPKRPK